MDTSQLNIAQFENRKADHIKLALRPENQSHEHANFDQIKLQHEALPDGNFQDITISSQCLGAPCAKPFFISSMTAGHNAGVPINQILIQASERMQWPMGVGSQRRQLSDVQARHEWEQLRTLAPEAILFGNIGMAQAITTPSKKLQMLVDSLDAAAMIIHLNPLQECLQPEGTPQFKDSEQTIARLAEELSVPIIIKETGCGFSKATLHRLSHYALGAIDISGLGGTHWGRIEGQRSESIALQTAADTFRNWGISTVESLYNAQSLALPFDTWASGGVRSGLDAAKLLAMGATMVGLAQPLLTAALKDVDSCCELMSRIELELKIAMFCTGSQTLDDLRDDKLCR